MKPLILTVLMLALCLGATAHSQNAIPIPGHTVDSLTLYIVGSDTVHAGCYIVCQKLDTLGFKKTVETRTVDCPDHYFGCCVLHYESFIVWKPITTVKELVRVRIPCDKAALIEPQYLKVEMDR